MRLLPISLMVLIGCSQPEALQSDGAMERALACVDEQVPEGELVTPERADTVVEGCRSEFERWTRVQIERAYEQPFDITNKEMGRIYRRELSDKIELMKLRISKGSHQEFPNI